MTTWVSVNDCIGLPDMPTTRAGVLFRAQSEGWKSRKKTKGKGFEYDIVNLPIEAQIILKKKQYNTILTSNIYVAAKNKSSSKELEIVRQCPALLENKTAELNKNQRDIADARCAIVAAVLRLEAESNLPRYKAVQFISEQSRKEALPLELQSIVETANAKKGKRTGVGARILNEWVLNYVKAKDSAERLFLLAPGQNKVKPAEAIAWLPDYLAIYRSPKGLTMRAAYREFCQLWAEKYQGQDNVIAACPSYDSIRRAMDKLPIIVKEKFRVTGSAWRSLNPYIQRDWSQMPVNGVWVGDGHNLKMKVAHPIHGSPFSPEITLILDSRTRYIVGWSLSLSENAIAVADALRHAMETNGRPLIYYSDNGGGETNKMLDADITGILPRLGVEHRTGIPGNPQGRGIIERLNKEVPNAVARQFDTYYGAGADSETVRITQRSVQSAVNALSQGKLLSTRQHSAIGKLPSWEQLIDVITAEVDKYNNQHEHRGLPKDHNGKHYTPSAYRRYLVENENHEIDYLSAVELRDMFRPQVTRIVERGQVQLFNNVYFAVELAQYHKDEVAVSYDIHNPQAVVIRDLNGNLICKAVWNGNSRDAFPKAVIETLQEKRVKGMAKRAQNKIDEAMAELSPVIESNADTLNFSQIIEGDITTKHDEYEPLFLTETDKQRYENHKKKVVNN